MSDSTALVKLEQAVQMLNDARDLESVTHIHSMARAAEEYARAERLGDEAEGHAREIRLRAARKAGEMLKAMAQSGERYRMQMGVNPRDLRARGTKMVTIPDLGITHGQATRWQRMSEVPEEVFAERVEAGWGERAIADGARHSGRPVRARAHIGPRLSPKQNLKGLQQAAVQLQGLAVALDEQMLGDWSLLYNAPEAARWFDILAESLPIVSARIKRVLRERGEHGRQAAARDAG